MVGCDMLRLKSELYVQALVRRVQAGLSAAYIARRGDKDAGGIFIRIVQNDATSGLLTLTTDMDGNRVARVVLPLKSADAQIDERLAREAARDPDIWVVDIEDAAGRHFLEEKILGIWQEE